MTDPTTTAFTPDERPLTAAFRADGRALDLAEYEAAGGYEALRKALRELAPTDVTKAVSDSGLRGRGGAGYATGRKWSFVPMGDDAPPVKYVVCNGDEMEPGSFKDRFLIEGSPHLLVEGMALACYAIGATTGYIFVRDQYDKPLALLTRALAEARAKGYLGERILGSDFSLEINLHVSIGRYMCGEASGMLNALQSDRANPRWRPPHMASAGLWSRPTVVNNVESLCCLPGIVRAAAPSAGAPWASPTRAAPASAASRDAPRRTGAWELPGGHAHARDDRAARRRHARRLHAARRAARRRVDALRAGRRPRRAHGLRPHEAGRHQPGHRHRAAASTTRSARWASASTCCVSSPRSRAAGARRAGPACPGPSTC